MRREYRLSCVINILRQLPALLPFNGILRDWRPRNLFPSYSQGFGKMDQRRGSLEGAPIEVFGKVHYWREKNWLVLSGVLSGISGSSRQNVEMCRSWRTDVVIQLSAKFAHSDILSIAHYYCLLVHHSIASLMLQKATIRTFNGIWFEVDGCRCNDFCIPPWSTEEFAANRICHISSNLPRVVVIILH